MNEELLKENPPFNLEKLDKFSILNKEIFDYIFAFEDVATREQIILELKEKAKEFKVASNFEKIIKSYEKKYCNYLQNEKISHSEVAKQLLENHSMFLYDNDLYIYDNGVYVKDKRKIEKDIINIVSTATSYFRSEVIRNLELETEIQKIDRENGYINFKNGLYDLKNQELKEHTPDFFSINQINVEYKKDAPVVKAIDIVLDKLSSNNPNRKQTILEMIGYSMTTSVKLQKAFILYGETARNGKSTLINIISELIGRNNIGNVDFKELSKNRFAGSGIKGKILNTGSEMTDEYIDDISNFKMFITGDDLEVEEKFKARQKITPYAKFIFNANKLPAVADKTNGFYRRLQLIPLETSFTDKDAKDFNYNDLVSKEALEYLAKISVEAYLNMGEHFSNYEESEREVNKYRVEANSILSFINDKDFILPFIEKSKTQLATNVYAYYKQYCNENQHNPFGRNKFYKEFERSGLVVVGVYNKQKTYIFDENYYKIPEIPYKTN